MTILCDGIAKAYELINSAAKGDMPAMKLKEHCDFYYAERTVGFSRQYAARGVQEQVDLLIRIWYDNTIRIGMYCIPEDGEQYRITNVQHLYDDGLKVTDLTLQRLEQNYEVDAET